MAFILSFIFIKCLIEYQRKKRIGQTEREEGLHSHKKKNNTPIFGGLGFIISYLLILTFLLIIDKLDILIYLLIVFPMVSYSLEGVSPVKIGPFVEKELRRTFN